MTALHYETAARNPRYSELSLSGPVSRIQFCDDVSRSFDSSLVCLVDSEYSRSNSRSISCHTFLHIYYPWKKCAPESDVPNNGQLKRSVSDGGRNLRPSCALSAQCSRKSVNASKPAQDLIKECLKDSSTLAVYPKKITKESTISTSSIAIENIDLYCFSGTSDDVSCECYSKSDPKGSGKRLACPDVPSCTTVKILGKKSSDIPCTKTSIPQKTSPQAAASTEGEQLCTTSELAKEQNRQSESIESTLASTSLNPVRPCHVHCRAPRRRCHPHNWGCHSLANIKKSESNTQSQIPIEVTIRDGLAIKFQQLLDTGARLAGYYPYNCANCDCIKSDINNKQAENIDHRPQVADSGRTEIENNCIGASSSFGTVPLESPPQRTPDPNNVFPESFNVKSETPPTPESKAVAPNPEEYCQNIPDTPNIPETQPTEPTSPEAALSCNAPLKNLCPGPAICKHPPGSQMPSPENVNIRMSDEMPIAAPRGYKGASTEPQILATQSRTGRQISKPPFPSPDCPRCDSRTPEPQMAGPHYKRNMPNPRITAAKSTTKPGTCEGKFQTPRNPNVCQDTTHEPQVAHTQFSISIAPCPDCSVCPRTPERHMPRNFAQTKPAQCECQLPTPISPDNCQVTTPEPQRSQSRTEKQISFAPSPVCPVCDSRTPESQIAGPGIYNRNTPNQRITATQSKTKTGTCECNIQIPMSPDICEATTPEPQRSATQSRTSTASCPLCPVCDARPPEPQMAVPGNDKKKKPKKPKTQPVTCECKLHTPMNPVVCQDTTPGSEISTTQSRISTASGPVCPVCDARSPRPQMAVPGNDKKKKPKKPKSQPVTCECKLYPPMKPVVCQDTTPDSDLSPAQSKISIASCPVCPVCDARTPKPQMTVPGNDKKKKPKKPKTQPVTCECKLHTPMKPVVCQDTTPELELSTTQSRISIASCPVCPVCESRTRESQIAGPGIYNKNTPNPRITTAQSQTKPGTCECKFQTPLSPDVRQDTTPESQMSTTQSRTSTTSCLVCPVCASRTPELQMAGPGIYNRNTPNPRVTTAQSKTQPGTCELKFQTPISPDVCQDTTPESEMSTTQSRISIASSPVCPVCDARKPKPQIAVPKNDKKKKPKKPKTQPVTCECKLQTPISPKGCQVTKPAVCPVCQSRTIEAGNYKKKKPKKPKLETVTCECKLEMDARSSTAKPRAKSAKCDHCQSNKPEPKMCAAEPKVETHYSPSTGSVTESTTQSLCHLPSCASRQTYAKGSDLPNADSSISSNLPARVHNTCMGPASTSTELLEEHKQSNFTQSENLTDDICVDTTIKISGIKLKLIRLPESNAAELKIDANASKSVDDSPRNSHRSCPCPVRSGGVAAFNVQQQTGVIESQSKPHGSDTCKHHKKPHCVSSSCVESVSSKRGSKQSQKNKKSGEVKRHLSSCWPCTMFFRRPKKEASIGEEHNVTEHKGVNVGDGKNLDCGINQSQAICQISHQKSSLCNESEVILDQDFLFPDYAKLDSTHQPRPSKSTSILRYANASCSVKYLLATKPSTSMISSTNPYGSFRNSHFNKNQTTSAPSYPSSNYPLQHSGLNKSQFTSTMSFANYNICDPCQDSDMSQNQVRCIIGCPNSLVRDSRMKKQQATSVMSVTNIYRGLQDLTINKNESINTCPNPRCPFQASRSSQRKKQITNFSANTSCNGIESLTMANQNRFKFSKDEKCSCHLTTFKKNNSSSKPALNAVTQCSRTDDLKEVSLKKSMSQPHCRQGTASSIRNSGSAPSFDQTTSLQLQLAVLSSELNSASFCTHCGQSICHQHRCGQVQKSHDSGTETGQPVSLGNTTSFGQTYNFVKYKSSVAYVCGEYANEGYHKQDEQSKENITIQMHGIETKSYSRGKVKGRQSGLLAVQFSPMPCDSNNGNFMSQKSNSEIPQPRIQNESIKGSQEYNGSTECFEVAQKLSSRQRQLCHENSCPGQDPAPKENQTGLPCGDIWAAEVSHSDNAAKVPKKKKKEKPPKAAKLKKTSKTPELPCGDICLTKLTPSSRDSNSAAGAIQASKPAKPSKQPKVKGFPSVCFYRIKPPKEAKKSKATEVPQFPSRKLCLQKDHGTGLIVSMTGSNSSFYSEMPSKPTKTIKSQEQKNKSTKSSRSSSKATISKSGSVTSATSAAKKVKPPKHAKSPQPSDFRCSGASISAVHSIAKADSGEATKTTKTNEKAKSSKSIKASKGPDFSCVNICFEKLTSTSSASSARISRSSSATSANSATKEFKLSQHARHPKGSTFSCNSICAYNSHNSKSSIKNKRPAGPKKSSKQAKQPKAADFPCGNICLEKQISSSSASSLANSKSSSETLSKPAKRSKSSKQAKQPKAADFPCGNICLEKQITSSSASSLASSKSSSETLAKPAKPSKSSKKAKRPKAADFPCGNICLEKRITSSSASSLASSKSSSETLAKPSKSSKKAKRPKAADFPCGNICLEKQTTSSSASSLTNSKSSSQTEAKPTKPSKSSKKAKQPKAADFPCGDICLEKTSTSSSGSSLAKSRSSIDISRTIQAKSSKKLQTTNEFDCLGINKRFENLTSSSSTCGPPKQPKPSLVNASAHYLSNLMSTIKSKVEKRVSCKNKFGACSLGNIISSIKIKVKKIVKAPKTADQSSATVDRQSEYEPTPVDICFKKLTSCISTSSSNISKMIGKALSDKRPKPEGIETKSCCDCPTNLTPSGSSSKVTPQNSTELAKTGKISCSCPQTHPPCWKTSSVTKVAKPPKSSKSSKKQKPSCACLPTIPPCSNKSSVTKVAKPPKSSKSSKKQNPCCKCLPTLPPCSNTPSVKNVAKPSKSSISTEKRKSSCACPPTLPACRDASSVTNLTKSSKSAVKQKPSFTCPLTNAQCENTYSVTYIAKPRKSSKSSKKQKPSCTCLPTLPPCSNTSSVTSVTKPPKASKPAVRQKPSCTCPPTLPSCSNTPSVTNVTPPKASKSSKKQKPCCTCLPTLPPCSNTPSVINVEKPPKSSNPAIRQKPSCTCPPKLPLCENASSVTNVAKPPKSSKSSKKQKPSCTCLPTLPPCSNKSSVTNVAKPPKSSKSSKKQKPCCTCLPTLPPCSNTPSVTNGAKPPKSSKSSKKQRPCCTCLPTLPPCSNTSSVTNVAKPPKSSKSAERQKPSCTCVPTLPPCSNTSSVTNVAKPPKSSKSSKKQKRSCTCVPMPPPCENACVVTKPTLPTPTERGKPSCTCPPKLSTCRKGTTVTKVAKAPKSAGRGKVCCTCPVMLSPDTSSQLKQPRPKTAVKLMKPTSYKGDQTGVISVQQYERNKKKKKKTKILSTETCLPICPAETTSNKKPKKKQLPAIDCVLGSKSSLKGAIIFCECPASEPGDLFAEPKHWKKNVTQCNWSFLWQFSKPMRSFKAPTASLKPAKELDMYPWSEPSKSPSEVDPCPCPNAGSNAQTDATKPEPKGGKMKFMHCSLPVLSKLSKRKKKSTTCHCPDTGNQAGRVTEAPQRVTETPSASPALQGIKVEIRKKRP